MYLRHTTIRKDGKVHRYWRLVRSVRVGRRVVQQTVAQLGELDDRGRVEARLLSRRLIGAPEQAALFDDGSEHMTVPVRLKGLRIERSRRFGDVNKLVAKRLELLSELVPSATTLAMLVDPNNPNAAADTPGNKITSKKSPLGDFENSLLMRLHKLFFNH
jgi:hypothetical protein